MRGSPDARALAAQLTFEDVEVLNIDFTLQVREFNLHYDCRHCVHLDEPTSTCSMDYPNQTLLDAAEAGVALTEDGNLVFCKYFEVN